jgi:hypothetical protein
MLLHRTIPLFVLLTAASGCVAQSSSARSFYLDCSASQAGDGGSSQSPWNKIEQLETQTYLTGDTIYIRRGTECHGELAPKGSGTEGAPIRLTAYGEGGRPKVIAPAKSREAFRLFNQEYWDIDSLDISGGTMFGVFISGDKGVLRHIYLANLAVHDVMGGAMKNKDNGLVVITPGSVDQHFDDVSVDGVTAWNTNQWMGIMVGGGSFGFPPESTWSTNVSIRNSAIHDVQGDGIVLFRERGGKIETSVAWNTGMQETQSVGTPNAIWTWMCHDCTVEQTEVFLTDSPGVDGGAFDIDYGNTNNAVLNNYGHDTQGYCIAVFGAGFVTRQSIVRGNLCVNNARSPRMAKYQGAIFVYTWNGGSIDGATIEDNTVYWNPNETAPALINNGEIAQGSAVFRNNTIYSTSPWLTDSNKSLKLEQNRYTYFGVGQPEWRWDAKTFYTLAQMQSGAQQDSGSSFDQRPLQDWASVVPRTSARVSSDSIFEQKFADDADRPFPVARKDSHWRLYSLVPLSFDDHGLISDEALRQIVFLKSLDRQYRARGLDVVLLLAVDPHSLHTEMLRNALTDLDLGGMPVAYSTPGAGAIEHSILVSPQGEIIQQWKGFAGPAALGLAARAWLGEPAFSQMGVGGK